MAAADPIPLPSKSDRWIEVRTQNFILYADASESKTKDVGLDMERLRTVLLAMKRGSAYAPVPTWIYVFKNHAALEPYLPRRNGEPEDWAGYFQGTGEGNYAALTAAWNADPRPIVYHSYIYQFIRANFPSLPAWYEEGVAEYYSTFQTEGEEARTGMIREDHLAYLRNTMMMSLDRLLAVQRGDPEVEDPKRADLFYAESWAFVHYLMRGNESRTPQLGTYLALIAKGRPRDEAFREAFGADYATVFGELVAYIRNKRFFYNRVRFAELKPPTETHVSAMTYQDVLIRLGDLLTNMGDGRFAEAERYYEAALSADPASAGALGGLGLLRKRQKRDEDAQGLLRKSIAAGSTDFRVYYAEGRYRWEALVARPHPASGLGPEERALLDRARADFRKSAELERDFPEALAALGRTYTAEPRGASLDDGIAALEEAHKRLPSREDVSLDLARLYEHKGDAAHANAVVKTVSGPQAAEALAQHKSESDFEARVAEINTLLEAGKVDEALVVLDRVIDQSSGEVRVEMEKQRAILREGAAHNHAIAQYNAALALYNQHDAAGAIAALRKLAAETADAEVAAKARATADDISRRKPK